MTRSAHLLLILGAASLVLVAGAPVHAGPDETEARLKSYDIDAPLRKRIHQAIDRSVAFLRGKQRESGSFQGDTRFREFRTGMNALCALALRHADTTEGRAGADKALRWLAGSDGRGRKATKEGSYTGGITAMLLWADRSHPEWAQTIGKQIHTSQRRRSGWWGYGIRGPHSSATSTQTDISNLSTTQFAALGLHAAQRMGATVPSAVWRRHLEGLLRAQTKNGSWPYMPNRAGAGSQGYWTGTFMGFANLMICKAALAEEIAKDTGLTKRLLKARLSGLGALRKSGRQFLTSLEASPNPDFYGLYALEKACVFAGVETLGDMPWYRTGAEALLVLQNADGGWRGGVLGPRGGLGGTGRTSSLLPTAFGLLFLLRGSEVYRPVTPRHVGKKPPAPVTSSGGGK